MNILPKKKWHVRTKENVARVQRDEENARLQDEVERGRISKAESEARIDLLRKQAVSKYNNFSNSGNAEHINLFSGLTNKTNNLEASREKEKEQKDWEIKVGYLKLLGQGSSELAEDKPWYQKSSQDLLNVNRKRKRGKISNSTELLDPFMEMKKRAKTVDYATPIPDEPETVLVDIDFHDKVVDLSNQRKKCKAKNIEFNLSSKIEVKKKKKSKKKKKRKKSSSSGDEKSKKSLDQLREERVKREQAEHIRAQKLLNPNASSSEFKNDDTLLRPKMKQKYNSQFNPTYVRSNYKPRSSNYRK